MVLLYGLPPSTPPSIRPVPRPFTSSTSLSLFILPHPFHLPLPPHFPSSFTFLHLPLPRPPSPYLSLFFSLTSSPSIPHFKLPPSYLFTPPFVLYLSHFTLPSLLLFLPSSLLLSIIDLHSFPSSYPPFIYPSFLSPRLNFPPSPSVCLSLLPSLYHLHSSISSFYLAPMCLTPSIVLCFCLTSSYPSFSPSLRRHLSLILHPLFPPSFIFLLRSLVILHSL